MQEFTSLAASAEHEREAISQRAKGAFQAAKKRGTWLGNPRWAEFIAGGAAGQVPHPARAAACRDDAPPPRRA